MTPQEYIDRERHRAQLNLGWAIRRNDDAAMQRLAERLQVLYELERGLKPTATREQVEKAWKGESLEKRDPHNIMWIECSGCGYAFDGYCEAPINFCPKCGAVFTDEAVRMVMDRLNEMTSEEEN